MTLVRRNCGTGHTYTLDDKKVKGVTTLIKLGYPAPGLIGWTGKVVAQFVADADESELAALRTLGRDPMIAALRALPFADRNKAARRGSTVHTLAERLARGEQLVYGVDIDPELEGHVESVAAFLDQWHPQPVLTETVIGNRWVPYAGTLDMVADIPGHGRVLLDYKTGDSGIWPETVLQLAAYRYADFYVGTDGTTEMPMTEVGIERTYAVWVRADGYDVIPLDTGPDRDTSPAFTAFRGAAYTARRVDDIPGLIGPPLLTPTAVAA
jgi:RecB family exonuclease